MGYQTIEFEVRGHTACVTLNRPEVLNAINDEMIAELAEVYAEVETSSDIWTLIITGAGRALCVGADVNKAADHDMENAAGIDNQGEPILSSLRQWDAPQEATPPWLQMTKPIICAVNGIACGAGMDLVTTADITIAAESASLMDPHVSIGVASGREAVRLARILPLPVAMRLVLMGRHERLSAQRAYDLGIFTEVVPDAALLDRSWEIAEIVNANAPLAVRGSRMAVRNGLTLPIHEAELLAENYRMKVALTKDAIEGPRAFLEKRTPQWQAR
ncbi:enoyl-CoA hydratase/isomerase family protein [Mycolicibacter hiberniae]|uniref:Crotonase n=2 Tax=Mycolicibacter hiberniae TaxID=29314 RepID=A0A7I7X9Z1_9MYCO|nr:enoyl-CoA hydratase-related protein [Mycolicibacter hiberniae]MCV7087094.1 enoyl-CoA hydratase/isomerase family protein [Mycolicibacter hiberniae]ORV67898.1 crotonase [Mycolicibacter hiberniae]BBZ25697.1 crotonase [Mycolicibacter hiberniae]